MSLGGLGGGSGAGKGACLACEPLGPTNGHLKHVPHTHTYKVKQCKLQEGDSLELELSLIKHTKLSHLAAKVGVEASVIHLHACLEYLTFAFLKAIYFHNDKGLFKVKVGHRREAGNSAKHMKSGNRCQLPFLGT